MSGPAPILAPGARWAILAGVAGLVALAVAFLPFGAGLIAIVFASVGLAAGVAAKVRNTPHPRLAVTGIITSALAIVLAAAMVAVYHTGTDTVDARSVGSSWAGFSDNTDEIVRDHLRVDFGQVDPAERALLPVTLTSKLERSAKFHIVVAGFVRGKEIARDTEFVTLAAKASQHVTMFHRYSIDARQRLRLPRAHFRVVEATIFWHTG